MDTQSHIEDRLVSGIYDTTVSRQEYL